MRKRVLKIPRCCFGLSCGFRCQAVCWQAVQTILPMRVFEPVNMTFFARLGITDQLSRQHSAAQNAVGIRDSLGRS